MRDLVRSAVLVCALVATACGGGSSPTGPTGSVPGTPTLQSPANAAQLDTLRPTLTAGGGSGGAYEFEISDRSDFSAASGPQTFLTSLIQTVVASGGTASLTPSRDLQPATRFYWRVRAKQGDAVSGWSETRTFLTKITGYSIPGELYDPLIGDTIGTRIGSTSFAAGDGLRVNDSNSYVRYQLGATIVNGQFSVEVKGLYPNGPGAKLRVFSMMDGTGNLFVSRYLLNVQYRGIPGNPDNAISFKALFGSNAAKLEPEFHERAAAVMALNPAETYHWKAIWNNEFRLVIEEGGIGGRVIYNMGKDAGGATYDPPSHHAYLGANNGPFGEEDGSWPGAAYRNLWIANRERPATLGNALRPQ